MDIICEIALIYAVVVFIMILLFIINTASSFNYEANKSIKLLNHIMVSNAKRYVPKRNLKSLSHEILMKVKVKKYVFDLYLILKFFFS